MKIKGFVFLFLCVSFLPAQQDKVTTARDGFLAIVTDARAAALGDIGVATSTDAFSQYWNPSKYIFSGKKSEIGITQIFEDRNQLSQFSQISFIFYNKIDARIAYALSVRNYSYPLDFYSTHEVAIDGSYALRLSDVFAMSVSGRFISLKNKTPLFDGSGIEAATSLYGIDVSGFYKGKEIAYKKFNGRWRAGFNFSNLRGESPNDNTNIEIYAPSTLKVGAGFDFIFNQDALLGITTEYKMLLDSYTENVKGEKLNFGLEGAVVALGLEYAYKEKLITRLGYSQGINRSTDSFISLGAGIVSRYVAFDIAFLLGIAEEENPIRNKLRISLGLDLDEVFSKAEN